MIYQRVSATRAFLRPFRPSFKNLRHFLFLFFLVFLPLNTALANFAVDKSWEEHLESQRRVLQEQIANDPEVIKLIALANEKNARYTPKEIMEIDQQWQETEGVDLFVVSLITNDLAEKLKAFQKKHRTLVEIFITDQRGLLIASTNKTSDFFQGDERWWQEIYELKDPKGFWGDVAYDESALAEAVPLYLAIFDDKQQEVLGFLKAVCSKNKILRRPF